MHIRKANPIDAVRAIAAGDACRGAAAMVTGARSSELERAAGGWQLEWFAIPVMMMTAAAALEALRACAESLTADVDRMHTNLRGRPTDGAVPAAAALTDRILGRYREVAQAVGFARPVGTVNELATERREG